MSTCDRKGCDGYGDNYNNNYGDLCGDCLRELIARGVSTDIKEFMTTPKAVGDAESYFKSVFQLNYGG